MKKTVMSGFAGCWLILEFHMLILLLFYVAVTVQSTTAHDPVKHDLSKLIGVSASFIVGSQTI
uniref:Uncharacterized protein n=1 Tax=Arundo donax TaxID=35708 RepID=A0A0A9EGX4_ARUDO